MEVVIKYVELRSGVFLSCLIFTPHFLNTLEGGPYGFGSH